MRFTAIIPAAPVRDARSAPTYPGVAFAKAAKSKSPSSLSFDAWTRNILVTVSGQVGFELNNSLGSCLLVGHSHAYFMVESTCTSERGIERIWTVSCSDDNNWLVIRFIPGHV